MFSVLPRTVYETDNFAEATVECMRLWGKGLSQQSYALKSKLFEVDGVASSDNRLHEIHPEVSFAAMSKETLAWSKKSWNGQALRIELLASHGIAWPSDIGEAGGAPVDDILDAAACAWSADRLRLGRAQPLPADLKAGEPAIWY